MAKSSTGMGPRLLYVLIVGTVIVASLALRVWDPSPVARLRSLVFDAYQRLSPRAFDPSLPVRVVDIDEDSLKAVGQWPWPRTVLADLVDKLAAGGAVAIGFDIVFPEPDRMSPANTLRFWPKSEAVAGLERRNREAPVKRPRLRRGDRQGSGRARLHRRPARHLDPRDQGGLRAWRRRSEAVRALLPRRRGKPQRAAGPSPRIRISELDSRARSDYPPPAHGDPGRRHALSLLRRRRAEARPRRFDLCR